MMFHNEFRSNKRLNQILLQSILGAFNITKFSILKAISISMASLKLDFVLP